ncbi:HBR079Cp [Eremothecium sinecaudum]|uniref:HBR079Cp n=1 Tax=Eremothecium sinecaudum TaxID=45286 RepID=A0A109UWV4_9SACH|nr:HBR079Cp [Eremothecium sinecaudum]AMD18980.1 HBR079Cp [Eremothecium sinecaudum]
MSLPLKPLSIDSNFKKFDSKQTKFHQSVQKALQHFEAVTEWADYIASLGKLLKALQSWSPQFSNVKYSVPFPYQVSRRLASSLSPNLPSGVHLKTLDVYTFIFEKIEMETLSKECNIWVSGILPLMSYASISVKAPLVELYDRYLIQLPPSVLKLLVKPLIGSLFPGIEDESSEFQTMTIGLLDTLRSNLGDESLFWQSCFMVMISHKNRRLGGLVFLTKKLPSLNAVPHLAVKSKSIANSEDEQSLLDKKQAREAALSLLLPESTSIVSPEAGLLLRCLVNCMNEDNEILIQRGILDLLLQRIHLHSPVLQTIVSEPDLQLLVMSCCKTMLKKDMSLNRRIWNWLLGPTSKTQQPDNATVNDYFPKYGLRSLRSGLLNMIKIESEVPNAFRICLALMDRWEIGSRIVPDLFTKLMKAAAKYKTNQQIIRGASLFFDSIETNVIWRNCFQALVNDKDYDLLTFVFSTFNISNEEEIIVRHCPLIFLALLIMYTEENSKDFGKIHHLCSILVDIIPDRAYLPITQSELNDGLKFDKLQLLKQISDFYNKDPSPQTPAQQEANYPFSGAELAFFTTEEVSTLLMKSVNSSEMINDVSRLFVSVIDKIPGQINTTDSHCTNFKAYWFDDALVKAIFDLNEKSTPKGFNKCVFGIVEVYANYLSNRLDLITSIKLLKIIITSLWPYLLDPNKQMEAIRCLDTLNRSIPTKYIEGALTSAFIHEPKISLRLVVLEALWNYLENDIEMIRQPLQLIFDELSDEHMLSYITASSWVVAIVKANAANRLFRVLTDNLLLFEFFMGEKVTELDDLDLFTYHIQTITNVLRTDEAVVIKAFSTEFTLMQSLDNDNEDVSTYKSLVVAILLKFLNLENNLHGKSIRSALILLDTLIDGTENNFKEIVTRLLKLSSKYIKVEGPESVLIIVSLLNIISKVLSLSHLNGIKLDIFDDNNAHINYIDFLVSSVKHLESPLVISSYVKLLSESIVYFQNSTFNIILPLSTSITECIDRLFCQHKEKGTNYKSFALLIDGLEELMEVSHGYLLADENSGYLSGSSVKNDFLQNMVSNVFSNDPNSSNSKLQGEREVIIQSFKKAIDCSFDIWVWAQKNSHLKEEDAISGVDREFSESLSHLSYRYRFKTKILIEKLFNLEPLVVLEFLISRRKDSLTVTLTHVLDGNRPVLTLPHLMQNIVNKCNKSAVALFSTSSASRRISETSTTFSNLTSVDIMDFIIEYVNSLENAAIEDFYNEFLIFIREISQNYTHYESISFQVLELIAIISEKLSHSQFGQQKRTRKDVADGFIRYLNSVQSEDLILKAPASEEAIRCLIFISERLHFIVTEPIYGDRYNNCLSMIVSSSVAPILKSMKLEPKQWQLFMDLALCVAKGGAKVRNWKLLIHDIFNDPAKLSQLVRISPKWDQVMYHWSKYQENQDKLLNDLILAISQKGNTLTPTINPFQGWSDTEVSLKCKHMIQIAYLLAITPKNTYLLFFRPLMDQIQEYLFLTDAPLKASAFIMLRVIFLHFDMTHLADYWSVISYGLQTGLQAYYESLQIQEVIDSNLVLQLCKTLDLLLVLCPEDFSATNEWLFIIDTINCIYKTDPFMAIIDEVSESKCYAIGHAMDIQLAPEGDFRVPLLSTTRKIDSHLSLRTFFLNLSYSHYESMYGLKPLGLYECQEDVKADIITAMQQT